MAISRAAAAAIVADWSSAIRAIASPFLRMRLTGALNQRSIEVRKVNGAPIERKGSEATTLLAAGFAEGYRGFVLRGT